MGKSNKEKVAEKYAKLTEYDKASNRYTVSIQIERKEINGVPQMTFQCESYGNMPCCTSEPKGPTRQPLKKEFTDRTAFKSYIDTMIDEVEKQL
jgi:hypothetical protein